MVIVIVIEISMTLHEQFRDKRQLFVLEKEKKSLPYNVVEWSSENWLSLS